MTLVIMRPSHMDLLKHINRHHRSQTTHQLRRINQPKHITRPRSSCRHAVVDHINQRIKDLLKR